MNHIKYLGKFIQQNENIFITCGYLCKKNELIINIPINEWNVICIINEENTKSSITIQTNKFSMKDSKINIYKDYFRCYAIFSDINFFTSGHLNSSMNEIIDTDPEIDYYLDKENPFTFVSVPQGWSEGNIYKYYNIDTGEITAVQINFGDI